MNNEFNTTTQSQSSAIQNDTGQDYLYLVINLVSVLILGFYTLYAVFTREWPLDDGSATLTLLETALRFPLSQPGITFFSLYAMGIIALVANNRRATRLASWALIMLWYFSGVVFVTMATLSPGDPGSAIVLLIVLAGLLMGTRGLVVAWALSVFVLLLRSWSSDAYDGSLVSVLNVLIQISAGVLLVELFLRYARFIRAQGMGEVITDMDKISGILRTTAQQVGRRAPLEDLLYGIVQQIDEQFPNLTNSQLFLVSEADKVPRLVAQSGVGASLDGLSQRLGSDNLIERVIKEGEYSTIRLHDRTTKSQNFIADAAFPLRLGGEVIGILEIQSQDMRLFNERIFVENFQSFADNLALAVDNTIQYEAAQARDKENIRLAKEAAASLRKAERLNDRLTGRAWSDYLRKTNQDLNKTLDLQTNEVQAGALLTQTLEDAFKSNLPVYKEDDSTESQRIAVPLRVRGRVIGAIEFDLDKDQSLSPEDFDLMEEVSERFGMVAENARLVDESQIAAQREALVNQISSRLQTSGNVDIMLREAVRGLQTALKADSVSIRLGIPSTEKKK